MRLIDADTLKQTVGSYNPIKQTYEYGSVITVADIDNAPTITDKEVIAEFLKQGTFKIHIPEAEPFTEPVKTGRWIEDDDLTLPSHCSVCGEYALEWVETRYCPNCGAKMENNDGRD